MVARMGRGGTVAVVDFGQAFDFQAFGNLQEGGEVFLVDGHLPLVHEFQEGFHFVVADIPEEDDGMPVGGVVQHGLKVGGAGREDHFVGLQLKPVACQRHIHEGLVVQQLLKHGQEVVLVVVPTEAILLGQLCLLGIHFEDRVKERRVPRQS